MAHDGTDPILYDAPDKIADIGFVPPRVVPIALLVVVGLMLAFLMVLVIVPFMKHRMDGWTPIPDDVDKSLAPLEQVQWNGELYNNPLD